MKARAIRIYPDWPDAYKWADHIKGCSCMGCGNRRRWFGWPTMQEQRENERFKLEMTG